MKKIPDQPTSLPLVRLGLILPFVRELDRLGLNTAEILASSGLTRQTVNDMDVFVPAIVIYRFVEDAAHAANDHYLGVQVGEHLDLSTWPPFLDSVASSVMLVDFLAHFVLKTKDEASSVRHSLNINQNHAVFKEVRIARPEIVPAQTDAFTATYMLNLIRRGAGHDWCPGQVYVKVSEPQVLPKRYLGTTIAGGDSMGVVVRFPSNWLMCRLDQDLIIDTLKNDGKTAKVPDDFVNVLRSVLTLHLAKGDLNVDYIARWFGVSRQSLQRMVRANGTTLKTEITALKKNRACEELSKGNKSITEISISLGFGSSVSFTRAFKSWTSMTPSRYREDHRIRG